MKSEKFATALVRQLLATVAVANFSLFTFPFSLKMASRWTRLPLFRSCSVLVRLVQQEGMVR